MQQGHVNMAVTKSKKRVKSAKQLEREEYKYYSCENCRWHVNSISWCKKQDCSTVLVHCCKLFEPKLPANRDCTKCKHYNKRKNAASRCKIGIYNCKGVEKC